MTNAISSANITMAGEIHRIGEPPKPNTRKPLEFVLRILEGDDLNFVKFQVPKASEKDFLETKVENMPVSVRFAVKGKRWSSPDGETKFFNNLVTVAVEAL